MILSGWPCGRAHMLSLFLCIERSQRLSAAALAFSLQSRTVCVCLCRRQAGDVHMMCLSFSVHFFFFFRLLTLVSYFRYFRNIILFTLGNPLLKDCCILTLLFHSRTWDSMPTQWFISPPLRKRVVVCKCQFGLITCLPRF